MLQYKLSHYIVFTSDTESNQVILFSTISGKKLLISSELWELLLSENFDSLPMVLKSKLIDYNFIVNTEVDELKTILDYNQIHNNDTTSLYEVIQPSAYCQMGCYYCGQNHQKKNITTHTTHKLIDRIEKKIIDFHYKQLIIGWFGSEPLVAMPQIRDITRHLKILCLKHNVNYSSKVVTNGLTLSKQTFLELVNDLAVNKIEITLDGIGESHDKHRFLKNGKGTFERIYNNLANIINVKDSMNLECDISVRCNVDSKNQSNVDELIRKLSYDGLLEKISFYPIGIYEWGNKDNIEKLSKEVFSIKELEWILQLLKSNYNIYSSLIPKRVKNLCLLTKKNSEVHDTYGNIFSCTEVPYTDNFKDSIFYIGNESTDHLSEANSFDWNNYIRDNNNLECNKCVMLPVCGGGCPKQWLDGNIPCPPFKFNHAEKLKIYNIITKYGINEDSFEKIQSVIDSSKKLLSI